MLNSNVNQRVSADVIGQVSSYFKINEESLDIGDINKRYVPVEQTSYASSPGFLVPGETTFILSPTSDNMADWSNGFLVLEFNGKVILNSALDIQTTEGNPGLVWIGFKDAMDCIESYKIMSNGIGIYTQDDAIRESYITSCGTSDNTRKSDYYSGVRHSDIWKRNYSICTGTEVDFSDGSTTKDFNIKLKIDIRRFLPLSNIKFMPAFAGKLELRIKVSTEGMVCALSDPKLTCFQGRIDRCSTVPLPAITNEFVPMNEKITMITGSVKVSDTDKKIKSLTYGERYLTIAKGMKCDNSFCCIYNFGLDDRIYNSLMQRYSQVDLTFMTQRIIVNTLDNTFENKSSAKATLPHTPKFVDSIFMLFPLNSSHKTVYKNPCFTGFQLNCAGYGCLPPNEMATFRDVRPLEYLQNAMNLNTDQSGLRKEVAQSLLNEDQLSTVGYRSKDCTNFLIGFATEPDNCFQQGQTSNTPINYVLTVKQDTSIEKSYCKNVSTNPIIGLLTDYSLTIQCSSNGGVPVVRFSDDDITSPEA